jgi:hypothetical protein
MEMFAHWLVVGLGIYLGVGALFGLAFVTRGAQRIDPRAMGGSWGFRLAILPGAALLWPLLALRWRAGSPPPEERNPHRDRARASEGGR